MRIDSHQHFWRYSLEEYPWIKQGWPIRRDFLPKDLAVELQAHGFDGSVAVQARQSCEETRWLLELANRSAFVKGVVGWVDLRSAFVDEQLEQFASDRKFVGVRHVIQDEPDDFLRLHDFRRGLARLKSFDLAYDILIYPHQLKATIDLVRSFPEQRFVLDHAAKPRIETGDLLPWSGDLWALAECENVMCKVSGLVTEASWGQWRGEDFAVYLKTVFDAFGSDRVMFGSDWPVALLAAGYREVFELVDRFTTSLSTSEREKIFGANAARFYRL